MLDTAQGTPAAGVEVTLSRRGERVASGTTGADGRIAALGQDLEPGGYEVVFELDPYFGSADHLYGRVRLEVRLDARHHHLPLLISPYGVTAYRGT